MLAIASLLDTISDRKTHEIWDLLEQKCGLADIKMTPVPHFSWLSAENYNVEKIETVLAEISQETAPFLIHTSGIGIFTGTAPVLYLSIVKTEQLLLLHKRIWESVVPYGHENNLFYRPDSWIPHITLAYRDITPDAIACATKDIINMPLYLDITVKSFVVMYQIGEVDGIQSEFNFACP
jgi:2'-5' RNA ligase